MKIISNRLEDNVVFMMRDGHQFEVIMLCVEGEEIFGVPDIVEAIRLLQWYVLTTRIPN